MYTNMCESTTWALSTPLAQIGRSLARPARPKVGLAPLRVTFVSDPFSLGRLSRLLSLLSCGGPSRVVNAWLRRSIWCHVAQTPHNEMAAVLTKAWADPSVWFSFFPPEGGGTGLPVTDGW